MTKYSHAICLFSFDLTKHIAINDRRSKLTECDFD